MQEKETSINKIDLRIKKSKKQKKNKIKKLRKDTVPIIFVPLIYCNI